MDSGFFRAMPAKPSARLYRGTPRNLARLATVLRRGGLVAAPTETVYGLAANALDARACRRIFEAKGRPADDPLIVHIASRDQLEFVAKPNAAALKLAAAFWPGPLTIVLPKQPVVPDIVSSGLSSVAVRMPRHPLFRKLLRHAGIPLAAPSANPFGYVSPTTAEHVRAGLGGKISHILDGGPCQIGVESTIVDLRNPREPRLLRPGAITREQLETVLGQRVRSAPRSKKANSIVAPGMLTRHYSPRTPALLHKHIRGRDVTASSEKEAWVFVARPSQLRGPNIFWLSERGDLREVAKKLFRTLRELDSANFDFIHLELTSGDGLAEAINDRLRRAAAKE